VARHSNFLDLPHPHPRPLFTSIAAHNIVTQATLYLAGYQVLLSESDIGLFARVWRVLLRSEST